MTTLLSCTGSVPLNIRLSSPRTRTIEHCGGAQGRGQKLGGHRSAWPIQAIAKIGQETGHRHRGFDRALLHPCSPCTCVFYILGSYSPALFEATFLDLKPGQIVSGPTLFNNLVFCALSSLNPACKRCYFAENESEDNHAYRPHRRMGR